ncbi:MAG: hypothetical protein WC663_01950 [Patescibacteria group bacterium]|jgi:clan AA aspartic protease
MIKGIFIENTPFIKIIIGWEQSIQTPFAILDTGFTGDLQVTPKIAKELGLEVIEVIKMQMANGQIVEIPAAHAVVVMEGKKELVQVLISENLPLIGISLLSKFKYKAILNCKHKTVELEKAK